MSELETFYAYNGSRIVYDSGQNRQLLQRLIYVPDFAVPSDYEFDEITEGDLLILKAARTSTNGEGQTSYLRDKKLVRYLWENKHTSVFEQVTYQFTVVMPLYIAAQWKRHRTWHLNEHSKRYSGWEWIEFEVPDWHLQNTSGNKQGGDIPVTPDRKYYWTDRLKKWEAEGEQAYLAALEEGIAKEDARRFLGPSLMTCIMFTVDLKNLTDFIFKRCDPVAQREIRVLAYILKNKLVTEINPWVHELIDEAFTEKGWPLEYE